METKFDTKFRLRQRRVKDPVTGKSAFSQKNVLITMRVTYGAMRLEFSTGYHINTECWDADGCYAIGAGNGMSADEINGGLARMAGCARDVANLFAEKEKVPTQDEFKGAFLMIKDGVRPNIPAKKKPVKKVLDHQDTTLSKQDNENSKQTFNNLSLSRKKQPANKGLSFWDVYHEYEAYAGKLNDWSLKTRKKYETVFLFQCYTRLRYSDLANLRRCDVHEKYIEVTTIKTVDSLRIELNSHSRAILKKYEPFNFKDGKALPVACNQKMNVYLHELCEMAGFDEPIRVTYYRGNERFDEIKPKYKLIGTHTGRRSFICNALGMGISPQVVMKWTGHSDYKAMKPYIDVCDEIKEEAMKKFDDF